MVFGPDDSVSVAETAESLASNGMSYEEFSGEEANKRYPQQLKLPANSKCVYEKDGGILCASKALAAFQVRIMSCSCSELHVRMQNEPCKVFQMVVNKGMDVEISCDEI